MLQTLHLAEYREEAKSYMTLCGSVVYEEAVANSGPIRDSPDDYPSLCGVCCEQYYALVDVKSGKPALFPVVHTARELFPLEF
jgi:hypothetical protein